MARTIAEIEQEIDAAKAAQPELDNLNSSSNTAIWKLWRYIVAAAHHTLEKLVEEQAAKAISGTTDWYAQRVLEFQYGDTISLVDYHPEYLVPDESKRIVSQVSVTDVYGAVLIKVAKGEVGSLEPLSTDEQAALISYINQIKFAGVNTVLINQSADLLHFGADIYYNGQLDLTEFKTTVENTINSYIQGLPFNGVFYTNKLIDKLQEVEGLNDVKINTLNVLPSGGSYKSIDRAYTPAAGYFEVDTTYPLNSINQLKYIAE